MTPARPRLPTLTALAVTALVLGSPPGARGEVAATLFLGNAEIPDADLRLVLPGGTDLRFEDASWDDDSFDDPPYYGVRIAWWPDRRGDRGVDRRFAAAAVEGSRWGLVLDLTHAKAILDVDEVVPVRGRRDGEPVDGRAPVGDELRGFEMSHGLNTLTLSGVRRWGDLVPEARRVTYHAGLGAGVAVPHVEARVGELDTSEYQLAGPALQAVVGLDTAVDRNVGIALEARLAWVDVEADLTGGGSVETDLWLLQLVAGLSLRD